jgi:hypothetical protein
MDMQIRMEYLPVEGGTYSLFAGSKTTQEYYHTIDELADYFIGKYGSTEKVLDITGKYRNSRRKLKKCLKYGIPAIGIPLNANRCARWLGDFYPNSVNVEQVERLLNR